MSRTSFTIALTGALAFGAVALAPAASAADVDGSYQIIERTNGNGPDAFLLDDTGRTPIFFCDEDKLNQRQNICQSDPEAGGRF